MAGDLEFPLSMVLELNAEIGQIHVLLDRSRSNPIQRNALGFLQSSGQDGLMLMAKIGTLEHELLEVRFKRDSLLDLALRRGQVTEQEARMLKIK